MPNTVAYGFVGLESLFSEKLEDVNVQVVMDAIQMTVDEHNRQITEMNGDLFAPTEEYKVRFQQPGAGTLQPMDEWGVPKPVIPKGFYDVAFPIRGGGTAFGTNRITRPMQTVEDVSRNLLEVLRRDADWMRRHLLAAYLDNTSYVYQDKEHGALTIEPLANGDAVTYVTRSGGSETSNSYVAQAAAISDAANPFPDIYTKLRKFPVNGAGAVVAYVPSNVKADIEGLADFTEVTDPDIELGANSDQVRGVIGRGFGDEVLGKVAKVWIVETGILPDYYIISNVRGASTTPIWMREYPAASLKGLQVSEFRPNDNLMSTNFYRDAGFGAINRVGACVNYIEAGDTTYDIPAGFATPVPV